MRRRWDNMLLGFQKRFKDKIISGEKRQTIRTKRKYPIKSRIGESKNAVNRKSEKH